MNSSASKDLGGIKIIVMLQMKTDYVELNLLYPFCSGLMTGLNGIILVLKSSFVSL